MPRAASPVKFWRRSAAQSSRPVLATLRDAQLAGPREDGVLDVDVGARIDLGVDPAAALGAGLLLEHRHANAVGPELTVEDGDLDLHAFVGRLGRGVPVGDDDAAKWIGRDQRNEIDGVERGTPQIGVHRHADPVAGLLFLVLGAKEATRAEQAAGLLLAAADA